LILLLYTQKRRGERGEEVRVTMSQGQGQVHAVHATIITVS
jgi:hypothetical protein